MLCGGRGHWCSVEGEGGTSAPKSKKGGSEALRREGGQWLFTEGEGCSVEGKGGTDALWREKGALALCRGRGGTDAVWRKGED